MQEMYLTILYIYMYVQYASLFLATHHMFENRFPFHGSLPHFDSHRASIMACGMHFCGLYRSH